MADTESFSTFHIENLYFGVKTADVIELTKGLSVTQAPLARPEISGFINLRGQIVTAVDIRTRLNFSKKIPNENTISVFFKHDEMQFGLMVDEVNDILELSSNDFEEPPTNLSDFALELIVGVYKLPNKLLLILDSSKILKILQSKSD